MESKNKKKQLGNLVLFPGTTERMFEQAQHYAENYQYEQANELFEEALLYDHGDEMTLSIFAYSLYEVKNFQRAKEICEQLLSMKPVMYFEAMELYLTICMQLRQFKQVEKVIETLFAEDAIPKEQQEKFERLQRLNAEIAENQRYQEQMEDDSFEMEEDEFNLQSFLDADISEQLLQIHELNTQNIRPFVQELKAIVENPNVNLFIQSLILILLVEQQVIVDITVEKFGHKQEVNPAFLNVPTELPQYIEISKMMSEKLEQEPSILEMAQYLIAKHAIVTYPFEWLDYGSDDVAQGYIDYVRAMFGDGLELTSELVEFLQQLEKIAELQ